MYLCGLAISQELRAEEERISDSLWWCNSTDLVEKHHTPRRFRILIS